MATKSRISDDARGEFDEDQPVALRDRTAGLQRRVLGEPAMLDGAREPGGLCFMREASR